MEDDQDIIDAAMGLFEAWRSAKKPVYVAVQYEQEATDLEGLLVEVGEYVRFQDTTGIYKMAFLPHMFVHVSVSVNERGTTIKCEQSPYGPDIEISDFQRRPPFAEVDARNRTIH
jgi:hypothetical protein